MIDPIPIVGRVRARLTDHYVFPEVAAEIADRLAARAADYPTDLPALAAAVTADLQSVNGDQHLRLVHHVEPLAERTEGDDAVEWAEMATWAATAGGGVASVQHVPGNIGVVEIAPLLFPVALCGEAITAAMTLVADSSALILDLRGCLGGDPYMVAFVASYLWDREPVELSGIRSRDRQVQAWTSSYVPGRRFGKRLGHRRRSDAHLPAGTGIPASDLHRRLRLPGPRVRSHGRARTLARDRRDRPHTGATAPDRMVSNRPKTPLAVRDRGTDGCPPPRRRRGSDRS